MTLKVALIGGPGTGKTDTLKVIAKKYPVAQEAARYVFTHKKKYRGKESIDVNWLEFQKDTCAMQKKQYDLLKNSKVAAIFFDRAIPDALVYLQLRRIPVPKEIQEAVQNYPYDYVFLLDSLLGYIPEKVVQESPEEAIAIQDLLEKTYRSLGYKIIKVPVNSAENRAKFILKKINLQFY